MPVRSQSIKQHHSNGAEIMSFNPTKTHKDNLYVNHNTIPILSENTFMWLETRVHRVKEVEMSRVEAGVDCRCLSEVNIRLKHK